jgi:hypothetical protein
MYNDQKQVVIKYSRRGGIGALSLKITYLHLAITFLKEKILRHRFFLCEGERGGFLLQKNQLITVNSHFTTNRRSCTIFSTFFDVVYR